MDMHKRRRRHDDDSRKSHDYPRTMHPGTLRKKSDTERHSADNHAHERCHRLHRGYCKRSMRLQAPVWIQSTGCRQVRVLQRHFRVSFGPVHGLRLLRAWYPRLFVPGSFRQSALHRLPRTCFWCNFVADRSHAEDGQGTARTNGIVYCIHHEIRPDNVGCRQVYGGGAETS